jgi:DNA-binding beta-propeller fold protein YncE
MNSSSPRIRLILAALFAAAALTAPHAHAQGGPVISVASLSGDYRTPLDSSPSPDGATIYFTAGTRNGKAKGVFTVPSAGGAAEAVFTGAPFVGPAGIALSPDGQRAFVADPDAGRLFAVSLAAGQDRTPVAIAGTAGTQPRNLDVRTEAGQVTIYFTGVDAADGQPAVLKMSSFGAPAPAVVFKGAPLVAPDGIAVAADGTVYVADRAAGGALGKVFKIAGGVPSVLVDGVRTGKPAGIALTKDGSLLLVSAFQADGKRDQVLVVDTATGQSASVTDVVGKNKAAGGVHRAHDVDVFSWADLQAGGSGRVYRVLPAGGG